MRGVSDSGPLVVIECGVAATRAALIEDGTARRFWFGPARGDEARDQAPTAGRRFAARVTSVDRGLAAAFLDIGDGLDAYLSVNGKNRAHLVEGALVATVVKSPPRQGKGAVLKWLGAPPPDCAGPGRLGPVDDAALEALRALDETGSEDAQGRMARPARIVIDDGAARAVLAAAAPDRAVFHDALCDALFETHGAEAALEEAFARVVPLRGGGRITIDETEALTAIDVDTGALKAASPARLREKIALAAADEVMRQARLRDIGGHVVADFPAIGAPAARARFAGHLKSALAALPGAGAAGFSKSGLYSFTLPHRAQSLMERFTEPAPADPAPGRRFTLDWRAKSAIRALEHRLRAAPSARPRLAAAVDLGAYLDQKSEWTVRLAERYGARFAIVASPQLEERGFDLSE